MTAKAHQMALGMAIPEEKKKGFTIGEWKEFVTRGWREGGYVQPAMCAKIMGVSEARVSQLIKSGRFQTRTVCGVKFVVGDCLTEWMLERDERMKRRKIKKEIERRVKEELG